MALQGSGQIKLSEIATEYGGSEPHALSEYHDKGNAPASGEIQLAADFYGTSNALFITATGGTITTDGDYKVHTFTGSGTFEVTAIGNAAGSTDVDYLIIAGGGAGGCYNGGGGGGAGGYRTSYGTQGGGCSAASAITVSVSSYSVVVGAGGLMTSSYCPHPASWYPGTASSALGIEATGGGGAGGESYAGRQHGGAGGSGGAGRGSGGAGTSCQGYAGQSSTSWTGGGGGAGAVGASGTGGAGLASSITGSSVTRGVGGNGGWSDAHGTANTGNGGNGNKRQGGSGVVIIRYKYQ